MARPRRAAAWKGEQWTRSNRRSAVDPEAGRIEYWSETQNERDGIVSYTNHYAFAETGEELVSDCKLRFRTCDELTQSLTDAGFALDHMYGDWDLRPVGPENPELIVVAVR